MTQYLILGAGVAGRRAAEIILKRDETSQITLIDEATNPFYYKPLMGSSLARGHAPVRLSPKQQRGFEERGVKVLRGARVTSLDVDKQRITCGGGATYRYDKLLIASGSRTARPPWEDGTVSGIAYFDSLSDAQIIARTVENIRTAIVYGSSIQALDVLRGLRGRGIECVLLIAEDRFWPGVLDPVASEIVEGRLRQEGITVVKKGAVQAVVKDKGRLTGVLTSSNENLPADLLVVTTPQAPVHDYVRQSSIKVDSALVVDDCLRTNRENVFAAGDVAQPFFSTLQEHVLQPGWLSAWRQGNIAGRNLTGENARYKGIPSLRTKAFDLDIVCLGMSDSGGKGIKEESGDFPYAELPYIYKKIVYKDQKVAGALLVGDVSEAGVLERWVREGLAKDQCADSVLSQMFNVRSLGTVSVGALCPVCKFQIQVEENQKEGDVVTCPACGIDFRLERMPNGIFCAKPVIE